MAIPLVVGFGEACQIIATEWQQDVSRIAPLTKSLWDALQGSCPKVILFGHPDLRICGNLSLGFPGFSAEEIITMVSDRIAISTGSACSSVSLEPSRVLNSLGYNSEETFSGIRISLGRFSTQEDIDIAEDTIISVIK